MRPQSNLSYFTPFVETYTDEQKLTSMREQERRNQR